MESYSQESYIYKVLSFIKPGCNDFVYVCYLVLRNKFMSENGSGNLSCK